MQPTTRRYVTIAPPGHLGTVQLQSDAKSSVQQQYTANAHVQQQVRVRMQQHSVRQHALNRRLSAALRAVRCRIRRAHVLS